MSFRGVQVFKPQPSGGFKLDVTDTTDRVELTNDPTEVRLATETSDDDCFLEFGDSTVTAAVATSHYFRGGSTEVFRVPYGTTHIAAIAASTETATLHISSGEGS